MQDITIRELSIHFSIEVFRYTFLYELFFIEDVDVDKKKLVSLMVAGVLLLC